MPRFRHGSAVVDAVPFWPTKNDADVLAFLDGNPAWLRAEDGLVIQTAPGTKQHVTPGMWLVKRESGALDVCQTDVFEASYTPLP